MKWLLCFAACLLATSVRATDHEMPRLSWGPYDFLKQGFRNAPWVRDPFFPEARSFEVQGIISDQMAYINGKWRRAGEVMDGYLVKTITPHGVTMTKNAEIIVLKLKE